LIISAQIKTDSTNIRLFYGAKGIVIFNWELNQKELRYHDPVTGSPAAVADKGAIPKDTWVTVRWTIDKDQSRVEVDEVERGSFRGDYANLSGAIGIGTNAGATITVKSL